MKTEMKKNNKTFLALAVVAALAMVSFAGIALTDDSAADESYIPIGFTDKPAVISGTQTVDYKFYIDENFAMYGLNVGFIYIPEGSNISGTISIGHYDGENYEVLDSITLTNAGGVRMTMISFEGGFTLELDALLGNLTPGMMDFIAVLFGFADGNALLRAIDGQDFPVKDMCATMFMVGNVDQTGESLPAGSYEVTAGKVMTGAVLPGVVSYIQSAVGVPTVDVLKEVLKEYIVPFNGTIKSADLEVTSEYSLGTIVSEGGKVSLAAVSPEEVLPRDENGDLIEIEASLSISGTGSVGYPADIEELFVKLQAALPSIFITDSVDVIIEDGAVFTIGDNEPIMYETVDFETEGTVKFAILIDSDGVVYYANPGETYFRYIPLKSSYTLVAVVDGQMYYGTATISGSGSDYKVTLGANKSNASYQILDTDLTVDGDTLKYDSVKYTKNDAFAVNVATGEIADVSESGEIIFSDAIDGVTQKFVVFLKGQQNGATHSFYGLYNDNEVDKILTVKNSSGDVKANEIKAGAVLAAEYNSMFAIADRTLTVEGTVKVVYNGADSIGNITNYGAITVTGNGMIEYGVEADEFPVAPITLGDITAAYYYKNETDDNNAVTSSTYYYTTIETALQNSNNIILSGKHVIVGEQTFDGEFDEIKITFANDASSLEVGIRGVDSPVPEDVIEAEVGTLNIVSKVTIVHNGNQFKVEYGKAVFDTTDSELPEFPPLADVRIINETKITYADLATGLDVVVSGETIELQRVAILIRDATVKSGVIFKDAGMPMLIPKKLTFTVDGEMEVTGMIGVDGKLIINGKASVNGPSVVLFRVVDYYYPMGTVMISSGGSLIVGENGVLDIATGKTAGTNGGMILSSGGSGPRTIQPLRDTLVNYTYLPGIFEINGTVNVANYGRIYADVMYLYGTLNNTTKQYSSVTVQSKLVVGKEPTLSTDLVNTAVITGQVNLSPYGAYALVYGDFNYDETVICYDDGGIREFRKTEFLIGENWDVYATQLSRNPLPIEYLFANDLKDLKLKAWYLSPVLRGETLVYGGTTPPAAPQVIGSPAAVYGDFEPRMYTITLTHMQGANWLVKGIHQGASAEYSVAYGTEVWINVDVIAGYVGIPAITKDNSSYNAGTKFIVTGDSTFAIKEGSIHVATGDSGDDGLTLIEILLIVIVGVTAVIAAIIALRMIRS